MRNNTIRTIKAVISRHSSKKMKSSSVVKMKDCYYVSITYMMGKWKYPKTTEMKIGFNESLAKLVWKLKSELKFGEE